jgi:hypothetical protein
MATQTSEKLIKGDDGIYRTEDGRFEVARADMWRREIGYDVIDLTRWERFRNYRGMPQDENVNTRVATLAAAKQVIANWRESPHGHATKEEARAWFRANF